MFELLSDTQKIIVFEKSGKVVVRACPGSGKTFSVAARLAHRIRNWKKYCVGVAALSFTNVAWKEIEKNLDEKFGLKSLSYPHFLGTLDSFINNFIFLPYGHLVMGCNQRPVLVGEPHGVWSVKKFDNDYDQYFAIVSCGIGDKLVYPEIQGTFFFGFSKIYKKDGSESQHALNLRASKTKYWKLGYANQHDANYFALKLLQKYPQIAKALAYRFPEIILDEAQDTNDVQMRIIEILCEQGLSEIMLVGDPDQAIFEWNNAKPKLFKNKYEEWRDNSVLLNDNRRSSQLICNSTFHLSTLETVSTAVNNSVKGLACSPTTFVYNADTIQKTIQLFLEKCKDSDIEISKENVAILCRSKSFINSILDTPQIDSVFWTEDFSFTYPIMHACFLFHRGQLRQAFKIIELVIFKKVTNSHSVKKEEFEKYVDKLGVIKHRTIVHEFLKKFPDTSGALGKWIEKSNKILLASTHKLSILNEAKQFNVENLFSLKELDLANLNFTPGTVHSVKGETFEAVLLFLKTRGIGKNYTTLIKDNTSTDAEEELRIVYVGITRPRKLLMIAVPNEINRLAWESKMKLKSN